MGDIEYYIEKGVVFIPRYSEYTLEELKFIVSKMEDTLRELVTDDYFKHQKELLDGNYL